MKTASLAFVTHIKFSELAVTQRFKIVYLYVKHHKHTIKTHCYE